MSDEVVERVALKDEVVDALRMLVDACEQRRVEDFDPNSRITVLETRTKDILAFHEALDSARAAIEAYEASLPTPSVRSEDAVEELDLAIGLIQEAKGVEGPDGGFITNHLDAAESHLEVVRASLQTIPEVTEAGDTQP